MAWAPDYITEDELAEYLRTSNTVNVDASQYADAISASSRAIDLHCDRQFGVVEAPEERFYTFVWDRRLGAWVAEIDDLMSTDDVVVEIGGSATVAYTLLPRNAAPKGRPWTTLRVECGAAVVPTGVVEELAMTAPWGWSAVPVAVKAACKLQSNRFLSRRDSPFGVAGSPDTGGELRLLSKVDPDVGVMLRSFVKTWGAV